MWVSEWVSDWLRLMSEHHRQFRQLFCDFLIWYNSIPISIPVSLLHRFVCLRIHFFRECLSLCACSCCFNYNYGSNWTVLSCVALYYRACSKEIRPKITINNEHTQQVFFFPSLSSPYTHFYRPTTKYYYIAKKKWTKWKQKRETKKEKATH